MADEQQTTQSETVQINDLDGFVRALVGWHQHQVQTVKHMIQVPPGTEMMVGDQTLMLDGDTLTGFKAGLEMALIFLGDLPFVAETDDAANDAPAPSN